VNAYEEDGDCLGTNCASNCRVTNLTSLPGTQPNYDGPLELFTELTFMVAFKPVAPITDIYITRCFYDDDT